MGRTFDIPLKTNDQSIDRVLGAGLPVLLVFLNGSAPAAMEQTMERLAKDNAGKMLVVQVQTKDSPEATRRFQVGATPAIVTVKNGQTLSKTDATSASILEKHAAYVMGVGPKPEETRAGNYGQREAQRETTRPGPAASSENHPKTVTDTNFDREVMQSPIPVLVDFWAPWCGPCRMTEPVLEKLAREKQGQLRVAKVNVDENPYTSQRYAVQSIPTMMVVRGGKVVDRWVGALPEPAIRSRVEAAVR